MKVNTDEDTARVMAFITAQFTFRAERSSFMRRCRVGDYAGTTIRNCIFNDNDMGGWAFSASLWVEYWDQVAVLIDDESYIAGQASVRGEPTPSLCFSSYFLAYW
jgi:hypothetical protein